MISLNFPHVAPSEKIQRYFEEIADFKADSVREFQDINNFLPAGPGTLFPQIKTQEFTSHPLQQCRDIKEIIKFLYQDYLELGEEIPITQILEQVEIVTPEPSGLRLCFAVFTRSLSLIIRFLQQRNRNDKVKELEYTNRAIYFLGHLNLPPCFYPDTTKIPIHNFGMISSKINSPTAFAVSKGFVFFGVNNVIYRVDTFVKGICDNPVATISTKASHKQYSLVILGNQLYLVSKKSIYAMKTKTATNNEEERKFVKIQSKGKRLCFPAITDGYYIYTLERDKDNKARVNIFVLQNDIFVFKKHVILGDARHSSSYLLPDLIVPCATNGTSIGFYYNRIGCRMFSLVNGRYIGDHLISEDQPVFIHSWVYDPYLLTHWCMTSDGMCLLESNAAVPPWILNFNVPDPEDKNIFGHLGILAAHFVGGTVEFPLSIYEGDSIISLINIIASILDNFSQATVACQTFLLILQVKLRTEKIEFDLYDVLTQLMRIFADEAFISCRRAAAFTFLSCYNVFETCWDDLNSKLLETILNDPDCHELAFLFLPQMKNFSVFSRSLIIEIVKFCLDSGQKSPFYISKSQSILVALLHQLKNKPGLFNTYCLEVLMRFSQSLSNIILNEDRSKHELIMFQESLAFTMAQRLIHVLMKNRKSIQLSDEVMKCLFALPLFLQNSHIQLDPTIMRFYQHVYFLSFDLAFRMLKKDNIFFECNAEFQMNNIEITIEDETFDVLVQQILSESRIVGEDIDKFLIDFKRHRLIHNINFDNFILKVAELHKYQPQPFRKIIKYLLSDPNTPIPSVDNQSSLAYHMIIGCTNIFPQKNDDFNIAFAQFIPKFKKYLNDFLCISREKIRLFLNTNPFAMLLPFELLQYGQYRYDTDSILKLAPALLQDYFPNIIKLTGFDQSLLIQPFTVCQFDKNESLLLRSMLLFLYVATYQTEPFNFNVLPNLTYIFTQITPTLLPTFLAILKQIICKSIANIEEIFLFLIATIGFAIVKDEKRFRHVKDPFLHFQIMYQMIDFCKQLLKEEESFVRFFQAHLFNGENEMIAFFAICNNTIDIPKEGNNFYATHIDGSRYIGKIKNVDEGSKKFEINSLNDETKSVERRKCQTIVSTSSVKFDASVFTDFTHFSKIFQQEDNDPVHKIFKITSLYEFSKIEAFRDVFDSSKIDFPSEFHPHCIELNLTQFWDFYIPFYPSELPPFLFRSMNSKSICRGTMVDGIIEGTFGTVVKDDILMSAPLHPNQSAKITFLVGANTQPKAFKLSLYSMMTMKSVFLNSDSLNFPDELSTEVSEIVVEVKPKEKYISVTHNNRSRRFPMLPSAVLHFIAVIPPPSRSIQFKAEIKKDFIFSDTNPYDLKSNEDSDFINPHFIEADVEPQIVMSSFFLEANFKSISHRVVKDFSQLIYSNYLNKPELDVSFIHSSLFSFMSSPNSYVHDLEKIKPRLIINEIENDLKISTLNCINKSSDLINNLLEYLEKKKCNSPIWITNCSAVPMETGIHFPRAKYQYTMKFTEKFSFVIPSFDFSRCSYEIIGLAHTIISIIKKFTDNFESYQSYMIKLRDIISNSNEINPENYERLMKLLNNLIGMRDFMENQNEMSTFVPYLLLSKISPIQYLNIGVFAETLINGQSPEHLIDNDIIKFILNENVKVMIYIRSNQENKYEINGNTELEPNLFYFIQIDQITISPYQKNSEYIVKIVSQTDTEQHFDFNYSAGDLIQLSYLNNDDKKLPIESIASQNTLKVVSSVFNLIPSSKLNLDIISQFITPETHFDKITGITSIERYSSDRMMFNDMLNIKFTDEIDPFYIRHLFTKTEFDYEIAVSSFVPIGEQTSSIQLFMETLNSFHKFTFYLIFDYFFDSWTGIADHPILILSIVDDKTIDFDKEMKAIRIGSFESKEELSNHFLSYLENFIQTHRT